MATRSRPDSNRRDNRPRGRSNRPPGDAGRATIPESELKAVITKSDPDSAKLLVEHAEVLGKQLTRRGSELTTSQFRAIFGEVRQIQAQLSTIDLPEVEQRRALRKLILLKPKMAYRAARREQGSKGVKVLKNELDPAIDLVVGEADPKENFQRFTEFLEAILAYHKAYGGK